VKMRFIPHTNTILSVKPHDTANPGFEFQEDLSANTINIQRFPLRASAEDITANTQSEDIKSSPYTRTRRHSIDCDEHSSKPNHAEESLHSRSMYELGR
jgi:hypothetical protein